MSACSGISQDKPEVTVLTGATIFDGTGSPAIEHGMILVKEGKIDCIGAEGECPTPAGSEVIDVTGKYITPGLVDAHVHFFQTGFFDSRPDALDLRDSNPYTRAMAYQNNHPQRYYDAYLCSGITGVYDVGGFPWSIDLQEDAENNPQAPHVAAAGPLITPATTDILNTPADKTLVTLDSDETGIKMVNYLDALESTGIKLWQLDLEDENYMGYVQTVSDEAQKRNKKLIAHATTLAQAKSALNHGAEYLVHSVGDKSVDGEFFELAKSNDAIYSPTLIVSSGYMLAYRAAAGVSPYPFDDPNGCIDPKTRNLLENAEQFKGHPAFTDSFIKRLEEFQVKDDRTSDIEMKNLKAIYDAGITIAVGTDAGNPGTLHGPSIYEEMEAMQRAGIPAEDLIVMATRNGAKAMQRAEDFGTLESGKLANLIVLDQDPSENISNMRSITRTMIKGEIKSIEELASRN